MPRVSDQHLEARRRQILEAARRCFAGEGFHSTSMQDILGECGLSAGAVYRYFPGKEDIIAAICVEALDEVREAIARQHGADLPALALLERLLEAVDELAERNDAGRIALQAWAEATRSPALRERIAGAMLAGRTELAAQLRRHYGDDAEADAAAAVLLTMMPGYLQAKVMVGDLTPARYCAGLATIAGLVARDEA